MDASAFVAVGVIFLIVGVLIGSFATHQDEKRRRAKPDPVAAHSAQSALTLAHECERLETEVDALYAKNNGLQDSLFLIRGAADARLKETKCPS